MTNLFFLLTILAQAGGQLPLERVTYELEITEGTQQVAAKLVLNQRSREVFSIHCTKAASGTVFTYWATEDANTLYIPRSEMAFTGGAGAIFQLLPNGPQLSRSLWLELLFSEQPMNGLGDFTLSDEAGWRLLRNRKEAITIRWREKSRATLATYAPRVLEPTLKEGTQKIGLDQIPKYWEKE